MIVERKDHEDGVAAFHATCYIIDSRVDLP